MTCNPVTALYSEVISKDSGKKPERCWCWDTSAGELTGTEALSTGAAPPERWAVASPLPLPGERRFSAAPQESEAARAAAAAAASLFLLLQLVAGFLRRQDQIRRSPLGQQQDNWFCLAGKNAYTHKGVKNASFRNEAPNEAHFLFTHLTTRANGIIYGGQKSP